MDDISTEIFDIAKFLYENEECEVIVNKYGQVEDVSFDNVDYEDFCSYVMDCSEEDFEKAETYLKSLLMNDVKYYSEYSRYLELSDNHTLYDITIPEGAKLDMEEYALERDMAVNQLSQEIHTEVYMLGRSGRHICVDNTFNNLVHYSEYKQKQKAWEAWLINVINQALTNTPKPEDDYLSENLNAGEYVAKCLNCGADVVYTKRDVCKDIDGTYIECPSCKATFDVDVPNSLHNTKIEDNNLEEDCTQAGGVDAGKVTLFGSDEKDKKEEAVDDNTTSIANWIKDTVEDLKENKAGCGTWKLDDRLAICVGWSAGYDENDTSDNYIHSKEDPTYCINVAIKVWTSDDMRTDLDYINYPYDENEVYDESITIAEDEDYTQLAKTLLDIYATYKDYKIDKDGMITSRPDEENKEVKEEARLTDYLGILQIRDILQKNPDTANKEFAIKDNMIIEVGVGNDVNYYKAIKNDDGEWELLKENLTTTSGEYNTDEYNKICDKLKQAYKDAWNNKISYTELENIKKQSGLSNAELTSIQYTASRETDKKEEEVITEDITTAQTITVKLNTGVLPIVDTDMYSLNDVLPESATQEELDNIVKEVATPYIKDTIQKVLPSVEIKATGVYHPKQYNFSGDELEFDLTVFSEEYEALKEKVLADNAFNKFLSDEYSSKSGFISTMPDSIEEFNVADSWKQLVQVIMFALRDEELTNVNEAYVNDFLEAVRNKFPSDDTVEEDEGLGLSESKLKENLNK